MMVIMSSAFQAQALKRNRVKGTRCNEAPGALDTALGFKKPCAYVLVSNTGQFDESGVTHWNLEKNIFHDLIRVAKF